uniref:Serpentine receptor class gamma n=1 Tax=Panagrellus redivivus TaxID=6233 RepID=A0A7E4V0W8_PANRE
MIHAIYVCFYNPATIVDERILGVLADNLILFLPLIYIIPSHILHLVILYVLIAPKSRKHFTGSFYRIFGIQSANNILHSSFYFLCVRGRFSTVFKSVLAALPTDGFFVAFPYVMAFYTSAALILLDFVLTFNRFSVILLKARYKTFWHRSFKYIVLFVLISPNILTWPMWFQDYIIAPPLKGYATYVWQARNPNVVSWISLSVGFAVLIIVSAVLDFLMNLYVMVALIKQQNKNQMFNQKTKSKQNEATADKKLFAVSICAFVGQLASFITQVILTLVSDKVVVNRMLYFQFFVVDYNTCVPAWSLFFMSNDIRRHILGVVGVQSASSTSVVAIATTGTDKKVTAPGKVTSTRTR